MTPQRQFHGDSLKRLVDQPGVLHLSWRGLSVGSLSGHRVLCAWLNRKHLNQLWDVDAEALAVIEWNEIETAEWIEDARPIQLLWGKTVQPTPPLENDGREVSEPLLNGVEEILEHIAARARGYSIGLR